MLASLQNLCRRGALGPGHSISAAHFGKNTQYSRRMVRLFLSWLLLLALWAGCAAASRPSFSTTTTTTTWKNARPPTVALSLDRLVQWRGGSEEEYDETDDSDSDEEDSGLAATKSAGVVGTLLHMVWGSTKACFRAGRAAFDTSQVPEDTSVLGHLFLVTKRMWKAAFSTSSSKAPQSSATTAPPVPRRKGNPAKPSPSRPDFGAYLADAYDVTATRGDGGAPILTGPLQDALRQARSQGRLLVALIPSHAPRKGHAMDATAIESFLSQEVTAVADRKAKKNATTASFLLWSTKAASSDAALAVKRLKVQTTNSKGKKRPILLVIYPHQVMDSSGRVKMIPRLLAQHHCSPPPSVETMAAWLNALRKRHAKQYTSMQTELRELELHKERREGYKASVETDVENKLKEKREAAERQAREEAEQQRAQEIIVRREELREGLPEEPSKQDSDALTIALRLADGRSAQRRFASGTSLETVFGWVDVVFEIERESVTLTTMNGRLSFTWDDDCDTTLEDSGLPKMAGLRVTTNNNKGAGTEEKTSP